MRIIFAEQLKISINIIIVIIILLLLSSLLSLDLLLTFT